MAEADSPRAKYEKERNVRLPRAVERGNIEAKDRKLIEEFLDAIDPNDLDTDPGEIGTKTASTLRAYAKNLRLVAKAATEPLAELGASGVNTVMGEWRGNLMDNTIQQRQSAARVFYRYHSQLEVDPGDITMVKNEDSHVDPRTPLNREEVDAIRAEFDNTRDRAMFDLMLYTGQRIRAVQTLKVGDVDVQNGRFYLNTEAAGLKGAKGKRPLLVAKDSVGDWLENHPTGEDDHYLITHLPGASKGDPETQVYQTTISRPIKQAAEAADIDNWKERGHPHNLRHSFVRWAYIQRGMDVQTIKYMGGWNPDSRTFEETYFNILDEEHAQKAEVAAGVREETGEAMDLTPEVCPVCDKKLEAGAKACPGCGSVLTPDAKAAQEMAESEADEAKEDAETLAAYKLVDQLVETAREDPEGLVEELEGLAEE